MKLGVYYDEMDGQLLPMWMLLPVRTNNEYETYSINAPFERFYPEDFNETMKIITVTQGALTRCPFVEQQFDIHIPTVQKDLLSQQIPIDTIYDADYFLIRMDDLVEILQFDIKKVLLNYKGK